MERLERALEVINGFDNFNRLEFLQAIEEEEARLPVRRIRRVVTDRMNPFTAMSDEEFTNRFRLRKDTIHDIIGEIGNSLPVANDLRGCPVPPSLQVLIALRYLATGTVQIGVGDCYSVSQARVSQCFKNVMNAIANLRRVYVKYPEGLGALRKIIHDFFNIASMPGVIGCLDCTHIAIHKPSVENSELFRCRKGYFSLNVQMVCGPDLTFYNVVSRWPGSVHDGRIFENSYLCSQLEDGLLPGHLLGDSGYSCRDYLMTPLGNPEGRHENAYDRSHIRTRNTVERAFGILKSRFGFLNKRARTSVNTTRAAIVASVVLHNIAIKTRTELPDVEIQYDEPAPEPDLPGHTINRLRNLKREQLIRDYF